MTKGTIKAFFGVAGSGKDYQCQQLCHNYAYNKLAFADALREMVFILLGMDYDEGMQKYEELKKTEIYNGQTLRDIMQHLGTECIRRYDPDFWCKAFRKRVNEIYDMAGFINICVPDMRFPNEVYCLQRTAEQHNLTLKYIFCDYHSERYLENSKHPSELLAQIARERNHTDQEEIDFNEMDKICDLFQQRLKELN